MMGKSDTDARTAPRAANWRTDDAASRRLRKATELLRQSVAAIDAEMRAFEAEAKPPKGSPADRHGRIMAHFANAIEQAADRFEHFDLGKSFKQIENAKAKAKKVAEAGVKKLREGK